MKVLQVTERRMFESLHQALLVDNGVADLLGQMVKINKALGLMDNSDDEVSNMSPDLILSKSQDKLFQDRGSIRDSYSGSRSLAKLGNEKGETSKIRESQTQIEDSVSGANNQQPLSNLQRVLLSQN
jgi:multidrug efflux pump subunit AcrA (membrane-fusion protein)